MSVQPQPKTPAYVSPEEYLAGERVAHFRSEYRDGEVVAMAGASEAHNTIVGNLFGLIWNHLRGGPCRAYTNDMRVRLSPSNRYTYPDIVAVCGERQFTDERMDTLVNPSVIIEVLSESTEAYDRGEKFMHYQQIESLREYVLVAQNHPAVERFVRQEGFWLYARTAGRDAAVRLDSLDLEVGLGEIYEGLSGFDAPE